MKTIQIKHRYTDAVLFTYDVEDNDPNPIRTAVLAATRAGRNADELREERAEIDAERADYDGWDDLTLDQRAAKLSLLAAIERELAAPRRGSDLRGSDLSGSDLRDSNLSDSNLRGSNLRDSNLRGSDLRGSDLRGSDLSGSDLRGSDLRGSDLSGSDLSGSDLSGSDLSDSDLSGSDLRGSDLSGSDLRDSNLSDSNLRGSNLRDSNLRGSDLRGSDLSGSDLSGSDLSGSDLSGSDLSDSDLSGSDLSDSNLSDSNLRDSNLSDSNLRDSFGAPRFGAELVAGVVAQKREVTPELHAERMKRAAEYRALWPNVPVIEDLDARILEVVSSDKGELNMSNWHSCETTHCRAGWAVHLAGKKGYELERKFSPSHAGGLIYRVSTGRLPDFYTDDEEALADLKACAALQATQVGQPQ